MIGREDPDHGSRIRTGHRRTAQSDRRGRVAGRGFEDQVLLAQRGQVTAYVRGQGQGRVRGISGLFGIELSRNFLRPYFSRDFTEFWKRWHISLSEWLRDYIFF